MKYLNFSTIARLFSSLASALAMGAVVQAQVNVPGDFPTPQAAVDASLAGSTIIIKGGTWGPLTIDKALTLIGEPRAIFEGAPGSNFGATDPAIFLRGPGSGQVNLVNLVTSATFRRFANFPSGASSVSPGITGSGFDALHLYDCMISAVEWQRAGLTGQAGSESGIDFGNFRTAPIDLWIQNSQIRASVFVDDYNVVGTVNTPAQGVSTNGDVVAINSTISGGTTAPALLQYPSCDVTGGVAVDCNNLFESGSLLKAGPSVVVTDLATGDVCQAAPGPDVKANSHTISDTRLLSQGSARVGQEFSLLWHLPPNMDRGTLYVANGLSGQVETNEGTLFLDPADLFMTLGIEGVSGIKTLSIPNDVNLIGYEAAFQIFVPGSGLSSPFATIVRP